MPLIREIGRAEEHGEQETLTPLGKKKMMEARAAARLRRSHYLEVRQIACEYHEGMLRLRGRVPSYYLKQIAQTVVLDMDGVDEIINQVEVLMPPAYV